MIRIDCCKRSDNFDLKDISLLNDKTFEATFTCRDCGGIKSVTVNLPARLPAFVMGRKKDIDLAKYLKLAMSFL